MFSFARSSLLIGSLLATTALPFAALAQDAGATWKAGDWMVRGRAIGILPDESSSISPIGGSADFSDEVVPEVDFSYFFTDNIAAELILATAKHDAKDRLASGDIDVGSAWVLPPTLTLQYHFTGLTWAKPYIGAGINYTMYLAEDGGSQDSLKIDNAFGVALQAGVDVPVDDRWSWNLDVKKLYVDADAKWNGGAITGDIDLDPWIIGVGVGYRF
jgi:outer membrane protein